MRIFSFNFGVALIIQCTFKFLNSISALSRGLKYEMKLKPLSLKMAESPIKHPVQMGIIDPSTHLTDFYFAITTPPLATRDNKVAWDRLDNNRVHIFKTKFRLGLSSLGK